MRRLPVYLFLVGIRRPIFAFLRRSLRNLPALCIPEDYNVIKGPDGFFSVYLEQDLVFVHEFYKAYPVPLTDS